MPSQTYDFSVPGEYTVESVDLAGGDAQLAGGALTGSVRPDAYVKPARLDSFTAVETPNGGSLLYGLEIDTVLMWHDGLAWVPSDGSAGQLNSLAQVQANLANAVGLDFPLIRPYVRLSRAGLLDPSPIVDDLVIGYTTALPNRQVILASDAAVALNTGAGGAASPGETRVTLDPAQVVYEVGSGNLWVFLNGALQPPAAYVEEDATHIVLTTLLDPVGPPVDTLELRVAVAGATAFLPAPTSLQQARPSARPDNFGGNYEFS